MCGPLALSLPIQSENSFRKFIGSFLYNSGRVITYALLGLFVGWIGRSVSLFGFQQWLSIILGVLILFFLLIGNSVDRLPLAAQFFTHVRRLMGKLYATNNYRSLLMIGMLNGLLPCGMVYMALAAGLASGTVLNSVIFMAAFGLGTLPVMWTIVFFANYLGAGVRIKIRRVYPYLMVCIACLLILRGMGLGIPYVSPDIASNKMTMQECYKP
jgi:sulfite exporter TauE/SafE